MRNFEDTAEPILCPAASIYGLKAQWENVPDEAFMVLILNKSAMEGISSVVKYRSEFNEAM